MTEAPSSEGRQNEKGNKDKIEDSCWGSEMHSEGKEEVGRDSERNLGECKALAGVPTNTQEVREKLSGVKGGM